MAIISCPECTHEVSSEALMCPSCGYMVNETILINQSISPNQTKKNLKSPVTNTERRKSTRINRFENQKIKRKARLKINDELALLIDLSKDGIKFSMSEVPQNPNINITLQIETQTYNLKGIIRWFNKSKSFINFNEIGSTITSAPQKYYKFINKLLG